MVRLAPSTSFANYWWSTGSTQPLIVAGSPGVYTLEVTADNGCKASEPVRLVEKDCRTGIYFPSAFTPNADGLNDVFKATVWQAPQYFELSVYNRWGERVFVTKDPAKGWNGSISGQLQPMGIFVWRCSYRFALLPQQQAKGTVLLMQ